MDDETDVVNDSDKTQAAASQTFFTVLGIVVFVAAVTGVLLCSVMYLEESGVGISIRTTIGNSSMSIRNTIGNSFQLLHQSSLSILTTIGKSFQLLYYKKVRQMPCFADQPARVAMAVHLHDDDEDYWAPHCTTGRDAERVPCPARGICTRGRLVGCADANYWRLAEDDTCVLTEAAQQTMQVTAQLVTRYSVEAACAPRSNKQHWVQDAATSRPLFPLRDVWANVSKTTPLMPDYDKSATWLEDAAASSDWLVVQRSNETTTKPPQLLVGLHPRQPLDIPLECQFRQLLDHLDKQVKLWLWTALISACQALWTSLWTAPLRTLVTLVVGPFLFKCLVVAYQNRRRRNQQLRDVVYLRERALQELLRVAEMRQPPVLAVTVCERILWADFSKSKKRRDYLRNVIWPNVVQDLDEHQSVIQSYGADGQMHWQWQQ